MPKVTFTTNVDTYRAGVDYDIDADEVERLRSFVIVDMTDEETAAAEAEAAKQRAAAEAKAEKERIAAEKAAEKAAAAQAAAND